VRTNASNSNDEAGELELNRFVPELIQSESPFAIAKAPEHAASRFSHLDELKSRLVADARILARAVAFPEKLLLTTRRGS